MAYLCDKCKHGKPAKRKYWQTSDGLVWSSRREYVRCDMTRQWTIEKRVYCPVFEQKEKK
jgi:hypothetical protein